MTDAVQVASITGGAALAVAVVVGLFNRASAKRDKKDITDGLDRYTLKVDGKLDEFMQEIRTASYARGMKDEKTRSDAERGSKM